MIFISFSSLDFAYANAISESLRAKGVEVWFAPEGMRLGGFPQQLAEKIAASDVVLVVASGAAAESAWVEREVVYAQALGKLILPVIIAPFPKTSALALLIARENNLDARQIPTDQLSVRILEEINTVNRRDRIILSFNMKGGVGKTILAANLASAFAGSGAEYFKKRVLLVDLDPQFNLSQTFFDDGTIDRAQREERSILEFFGDKVPWGAANEETMVRNKLSSLVGPASFAKNADLIIGHDNLFDFAIDLRSEREKTMRGRICSACFLGPAGATT